MKLRGIDALTQLFIVHFLLCQNRGRVLHHGSNHQYNKLCSGITFSGIAFFPKVEIIPAIRHLIKMRVSHLMKTLWQCLTRR